MIIKKSSDIQLLRDGLITKDDVYTIVHDTMKACFYLDEDELESLNKWQAKLIVANGYCLFERGDEMVDTGFMFASFDTSHTAPNNRKWISGRVSH
jgi:hypothetical protein